MSMNGLPNFGPDNLGAGTSLPTTSPSAVSKNRNASAALTTEPSEFELRLEEFTNSAFHFDELTGLVKPYVLTEHFRHLVMSEKLIEGTSPGQPNMNANRVASREVAAVTDLVGVAMLRCNEIDNVRERYGQEYTHTLLKVIAARLLKKPGVPGLAAACRLAQTDSFLLLLAPTLPPISVVSQLESVFRVLGFLNLRYLSEQLDLETTPELFERGREKKRVAAQTLPLTFSMGVALYPCDGLDLAVLQERAEKARQHSLSSGTNPLITEGFPGNKHNIYSVSPNSYTFYTSR